MLQVREVHEVGKYLGMPMCVGRKKNSVFHKVVDKVKSKLCGWSSKAISTGGKYMLLKTAAQSIPIFVMNLFLLPNEVCEKLEVQMNGFLWGHGQQRRGIL